MTKPKVKIKDKYKSHIKPNLGLITEWVSKRVPICNICKAIDVSRTSFYQYLKDYKELEKAIEKGYKASIKAVEDSLIRNAVGYEYTETKVTKEHVYAPDGNGHVVKISKEPVEVRVETFKKFQNPNATSQIFYLCNKAKKEYQNVNKVQHDFSGENVDFLSNVIAKAKAIE